MLSVTIIPHQKLERKKHPLTQRANRSRSRQKEYIILTLNPKLKKGSRGKSSIVKKMKLRIKVNKS